MWIKSTALRFKYLLLALAFVPITFWTFADLKSRHAGDDYQSVLGRAIQPLLPSGSHAHYLFAIASAVLFVFAAMTLFERSRTRVATLLGVGMFTGTIGIFLLLAIQRAASESANETVSGSSSAVIFHYVLRAIGYSYTACDNSSGNIEIQVLAFTFGVGLCEELTKVLPVLYLLRRDASLHESDARVLGFVSGAGFGVAEGIFYSEQYYNGNAGAGIYVVRFVSCVAFHGAATAIAAGLVTRHQLPLRFDWKYCGRLVWIISPLMLLHAIYDTFCTRGDSGWALLIVGLLLGLLIYQIESSRKVLKPRSTN